MWIKRVIEKQTFRPGALGVLINPYYIIRRRLDAQMRAEAPRFNGRVLDFGCGSSPYRGYFESCEYVGVDVMGDPDVKRSESRAHVLYDGKRLPFRDSVFDGVVSSEVFEHVFNPLDALAELHRVMKPGGLLLLTVPFAFGEHEAPYDYARYTRFALDSLIQSADFEVVRISQTGNYVSAVAQLSAAYVFNSILPKRNAFRAAFVPILVAPITIAGLVAERLLPKTQTLYCNNVVLARKN